MFPYTILGDMWKLVGKGEISMYDETFSKIYDEYGWDYFSLTMGESILEYFKENNVSIKTHIDLCCGVGALCDYFNKRGIDTTGVDISKDMINIAKNKNKSINFYLKDVLNYKDDRKYDLVTLTCDSVNHFLGESDLHILISNIYNMLNKNGYLIFDVYDKNKIDFNKQIISNRNNGIKVYYCITHLNNTSNRDLINTNVLVKKYNKLIYETNVVEKMYDLNYIINTLNKNHFKILKMGDKIMNEEQRFKDKLYVICQKAD